VNHPQFQNVQRISSGEIAMAGGGGLLMGILKGVEVETAAAAGMIS
jgi:hypothetical protein